MYQASIRNILKNKWVEDEQYREVVLTDKENDRVIFYSEDDAEQVLENLELSSPEAFVIVME